MSTKMRVCFCVCHWNADWNASQNATCTWFTITVIVLINSYFGCNMVFFLRSVLSFGCFLICLYTPWVRMISSFYSAFAERQNKSTISINLFSGCFVCRLLFCFILFRHICVVVSVFIYVRVNWFFIRFSIDAIGKRWHKHKQSCVLLR